jgi:hypothetical protein
MPKSYFETSKSLSFPNAPIGNPGEIVTLRELRVMKSIESNHDWTPDKNIRG